MQIGHPLDDHVAVRDAEADAVEAELIRTTGRAAADAAFRLAQEDVVAAAANETEAGAAAAVAAGATTRPAGAGAEAEVAVETDRLVETGTDRTAAVEAEAEATQGRRPRNELGESGHGAGAARRAVRWK